MILNYKQNIKMTKEKTDFSSIIFDMIYQKKPYIMFIPDENEPNKEKIYSECYVDIINGLSNGSIYLIMQ